MNNNTKEANAIKYKEIDTKLVIVCHCSKPVEKAHKQLYYVLKYTKFVLKPDEAYVDNKHIIPLGKEVSYVNEVDKRCPETDKWVNITDNSKTYVWGVYCPIYFTLLENASNSKSQGNIALTDILVNAYRVLTHDGKVIFTCPVTRNKYVKDVAETDEAFARREYDGTVSIITANTQAFMKSDDVNNLSSKYNVSIIKTNEFDFLIGQNNLNSHNDKPPPNTVPHRYMNIFDICVIFTKIVVLSGGMSAKKRNNTQKNKKKTK